ncbi:low molecular weight phosphotyrosine protein phosphatase [Aliiroseovarius crassostreae]|uniref:protein-tyrosine-phosphatase n=1 Tax=Aliiroseovarius crassostreae TaxID=154981 RepID=A0A9Q9H716_9RHOB|nr:low molecular weight protein-tyrosine-phosphatase [Aliiroseovarius crassostreae]UWP94764.1 low molecular weight phosphotyrosine protein phosphatase [Aliiroseovarius crassostreae]
MTTRILFVCLGNICRSPSAEAVFRQIANQHAPELALEVDSAGTSDWHEGEPPYSPMQRAARARGYELATLRARQFSRADFDRFDLIIGMDRDNITNIEALRPPGRTTPAHVFTDYLPPDLPAQDPRRGMDHVPDPYYTRDFDQTLDLVEAASHGLLQQLCRDPAAG